MERVTSLELSVECGSSWPRREARDAGITLRGTFATAPRPLPAH